MTLGYLRALLFTDPLIILMTIVLGTISLASSLFDKYGRRQHAIARSWSRLLLWISGVKMEIEGIEKLQPGGCYVFVANHQSLMDTPVVLAFVPGQFRFFAKKVLFHIPFLGTHLRRSGHLPVVREDPRAAVKLLSRAAQLIREQRISVLLFPESTRALVDELRPFKQGAAHIAIQAGVPLVPVAILGTRAILPIDSMHIRPGRVRLQVGDPIPTMGMKLQDRGKLTALARDAVRRMTSFPDAEGGEDAVEDVVRRGRAGDLVEGPQRGV
jgi:1-acyl-sn-glycerol-3-phosphate acyltransferase